MAIRRRYARRSYARRRPLRRTRRVVRRTRRVVRRRRPLPLNGFPSTYLARHRYVAEIQLDATAGGIVTYIFRANDMYDPDYSGTGHQPMGFDELSARYDHFQVLGSRITVKHTPVSGTHVNPAHIGVLLTDTPVVTSNITTVSQLLEQRLNGRHMPMGLVGAPSTRAMDRVSHSFSSKRFFGPRALGVSKYQGSPTSSPTEDVMFEVYAAAIAGNNPGIVPLLVTIDYVALYTEPRIMTSS